MKFFLGILCGLLVSATVVAGLQINSPKGCHCGENFNVRCWGHSMAVVTARVPNNTLFYTYTGLENYIDLDSVEFMHLEKLQNLTINTKYDFRVFDRRLKFSNSSQAVFKPLSNLKNLSISISWNMSQPMPEMFSFLNHLETLDLSFTRLINYESLQQSLKGLKDNHVLRWISLKNTQAFESLINGLSFNLSHFLEPIAHCPLQYLDLSYNSIKSLYPGLIRFAPNLTEIIVSSNLIAPFFTSAFTLEVILHPSLERADFSRQFHKVNPSHIRSLATKYSLSDTQGFSMSKMHLKGPMSKTSLDGSPSPDNSLMFDKFPETLEMSPDEFSRMETTPEESLLVKKQAKGFPVLKNSNWFKTRDSVNELSMTLRNMSKYSNFSHNKDCMDFSIGNICHIISNPECRFFLNALRDNHTLVCEVLKMSWPETGGIPCKYIPLLDDLLTKDKQCFACIVFPTIGNLKELVVQEYITYDQTDLPFQLFNTKKCFYPNKIQKMDFSHSYPMGFSSIGQMLMSPVTGFNDLRVFNFSNCGVTRPYHNLSASLQNVTWLDLSQNKLTLDDGYHKDEYFIGPPTVTYFNLAGNLIKQPPKRTLRTMHALETLNLDNNNLYAFSFSGTYLPNVRNISLQFNSIKSFSKMTMEQFNEHAQIANQSITIDLRQNPLLCTCNERDFVHWIQNAKTHNLHFRGIEDL